MSERLLDVKDLRVSFFTPNGEVKAVGGVSYHVDKEEVVAIVGESGCGKSVTQMSVMQLIQMPPGKILGGEVIFEGKNLLGYGPKSKEMRAVRGAEISMIFQEPMTSLNPVFTVGQQLTEVIRTHMNVSKKEAWKLGTEALQHCEAILYLVADQPLLRRETLLALERSWRAEPDAIWACAQHGVRGNPCLFPKEFFGQLCALEGDQGGSRVIAQNPSALRLLEVPAAELWDIDTRASLQALGEEKLWT